MFPRICAICKGFFGEFWNSFFKSEDIESSVVAQTRIAQGSLLVVEALVMELVEVVVMVVED